MVKIKMSYNDEKEKLKVLKLFAEKNMIKKVSKPSRSGEFTRVYIEIE